MKKSALCTAILSVFIFVSSVYAGRVGYVTTRPATAVNNTPEENLFSINGSGLKFVLLDFDDEGIFCTTKEFYGTQPFDPDGTGKFDIEDENNIAYWLNNVFPEKGGEMWNNSKRDDVFPFPELIMDYIVEHDWLCEAGYESTDYPEDYIVRAKLALMSVTEWKKYNSKIGFGDNTDIAYYYWLRSVNGTIEPGNNAPVMVVSSGGTAQFGKVRNGYGVRPVFYLSKDFFTEIKTDVSILGDNVKKALRENYTKEELKRVYSDDELSYIYKKLPPQAGSVSISGITQTGSILKGSYTYYSPEGNKEAESEYRWLRSKNKTGPYSVIPGANSPEFKIRDIDEGYYFVFEITPKTVDSIGASVKSDATSSPAKKNILCVAENVYVDGKPFIGQRLIARYNYFDENGDAEDGTLIRWQASDDGKEFYNIDDSIGLNYTIPKEMLGKHIRFTINVKSLNSDVYGQTVISEMIGPVESEVFENNIVSFIDNGVARMTQPILKSGDIPFWTVYSAEGKLMALVTDKLEYELTGNEGSICAGVFRRETDSMGGLFLADKLEIKAKTASGLKKSISVNGETIIALKTTGEEIANSLEIQLECEGVKITNVNSQSYDGFVTEDNKLILVGKEPTQINIPETVATINVSGTGNISIVQTKGVYEFGQKIIENEPEVCFE